MLDTPSICVKSTRPRLAEIIAVIAISLKSGETLLCLAFTSSSSSFAASGRFRVVALCIVGMMMGKYIAALRSRLPFFVADVGQILVCGLRRKFRQLLWLADCSDAATDWLCVITWATPSAPSGSSVQLRTSVGTVIIPVTNRQNANF